MLAWVEEVALWSSFAKAFAKMTAGLLAKLGAGVHKPTTLAPCTRLVREGEARKHDES